MGEEKEVNLNCLFLDEAKVCLKRCDTFSLFITRAESVFLHVPLFSLM